MMKIAWAKPGFIPNTSPLYASLTLFNVLLATFLSVFSAVATIISDSAIQGEMALSHPTTTWLTTLYMLGINTTVPAATWFADRFGYKKIYVLGISVFTFASFLAAIAPNFPILGIARMLEGVGAGMVFPVGLSMIVEAFSPKMLPLALILYMGASFGLGFSLGLPLSGYLTQFLSWRYAFYLIVPIGLTAIFLSWTIQEETERRTTSPFDLWGFIFFATFVASLLIALTYGPFPATDEGWRSPYILFLFALAAICLIATIFIENRHPDPIIPLTLMKEPIFAVATMAMFILGMSIFASVGTMMQYMIGSLGYERFVSGKMGSIYGITLFLFSGLGNLLIKKIPIPFLIFTGLMVLVYSYFLNNELDWQTGPFQVMTILILRGIGVGLALGPTTIQAMQHVPKALTAKGATLLTFFRQVGATYGSTIIGIVTIKRQIFHAARFGEQANMQLPAYQITYEKIFNQFSTNTSEGIFQSRQQAKGAIIRNILEQSSIQAFNDAMMVIGYVTAVIAFLLIVLTLARRWMGRKNKVPS